MGWSIENWDGKLESAVRICGCTCFPRSSSVAGGQRLIFLQNACLGCEKSQFVLKEEGVIWGFAFLSIAPSRHVLQIVGGNSSRKKDVEVLVVLCCNKSLHPYQITMAFIVWLVGAFLIKRIVYSFFNSITSLKSID